MKNTVGQHKVQAFSSITQNVANYNDNNSPIPKESPEYLTAANQAVNNSKVYSSNQPIDFNLTYSNNNSKIEA